MNIIMCGSSGRTGSKIINYIKKFTDFQVVGEVNSTTKTLDSFLDEMECDVVIDFTNSQVAVTNCMSAINHCVPFISGTTGIDDQTLHLLDQLAKNKKVGIMFCSNFSCGIQTIKQLISIADMNFSEAEISECHHKSKLDSPSGTALMLRNALKRNSDCPIYSKRVDNILATHVISFYSPYEYISISHTVTNFDAFGYGVVKALLKEPWVGLAINV